MTRLGASRHRISSRLAPKGQRGLVWDIPLAGLAGQVLLGVPILILPWLFGGALASAQWWLLAGVVGALGCFWFECLRRQRLEVLPIPVLVIPLMLALVMGGLHLMPVPVATLEWLAPTNSALWSSLSGSGMEPNSLHFDSPSTSRTLSLYPASTRHDLVLFGVALAVFFLGSQLFSRGSILVLLLGAIALNGAALSFFGIAQQMSWNGKLYGVFPLTYGGFPFASYVSRNSAACFLNMTLAAAGGLAVWAFSRASKKPDPGQIEIAVLHRELDSRPRTVRLQELVVRIQSFLAGLTGTQIFSLIALTVILAGILCAMSRGAWLGMAAAAVAIFLHAAVTKRATLRLLWLLAVAAAAFFLVDWLGRAGKMEERFNTLMRQHEAPDGRLDHWRDGIATAFHVQPFGSGLGTYRYIYPLYQDGPNSSWFFHAENQYLEALVEGGVPGLALMLIALFLTGKAILRLLREPPHSTTYALGIAGAYLLVSSAVHACFDFGLYLSANTATFALLCGAVCGRAAQLNPRRPVRSRQERTRSASRAKGPRSWWSPLARWFDRSRLERALYPRTRALSASLTVLLLCLTAFGWREIGDVHAVEAAVRQSPGLKNPTELSLPRLNHSISLLTAAVERRPDDAEAQLRLAQLWIAHYRMRYVEQSAPAADAKAPQPKTDVGQPLTAWSRLRLTHDQFHELWTASAPVRIHGWAWTLKLQDPQEDLRHLRSSPLVQTDLSAGVRHLLKARVACPLLSKPHMALAELTPLFPELGDEQVHLARVRRVAPAEVDLARECSLVEFQAGRIEYAMADWARLTTLAPELLPDVVAFVGGQARQLKLLDRLLPDDPLRLVEMAQSRFAGDEDRGIREAVLEKATEALASQNLDPPEMAYVEGVICSLRNDRRAAIQYLTKAVNLRPDRTAWRYRLAVQLQLNGDLDAAHQEARVCAQLEPANEEYTTLLRKLIRSRLTSDG